MSGQSSGIDPTDLASIGATLTARELAVQRTVRDFVQDHVAPHINEWFASGEVPRELFVMLGELGVLGSDTGTLGHEPLSGVSFGLACLELEAGDSGIRSMLSAQRCLTMFAIRQYGSDEQKSQWLPQLSSGSAVGCFGLTEPDAGSDPSSMRMTARREGRDWVLEGTKQWVLNGHAADVALVWARSDEGVRGFLVPRETRGLNVLRVPELLSLRSAITSVLILDRCRVSEAAVLPGSIGLRGPLSCLTEARFGVVWGVMGAARSCFDAALAYARKRSQFGRSIASFQLTQAKLADMAVELEKGLLLALHLGRLKESGKLSYEHLSVGKLNNVREALCIAREARTILGANGLTLECEVMRHAVNLESVLTYEGTSEIHQLTIGRSLTGLDAFHG